MHSSLVQSEPLHSSLVQPQLLNRSAMPQNSPLYNLLMVHFMSSENSNVWQLPETEVKLLAGEQYLNESGDYEPFSKRWKSSFSQMATDQQPRLDNELMVPQCHYNPLNEPSPLGLRLRKSPSLLELAQKRLNQGNTNKDDVPIENLEAETKRDLKAKTRARASSSMDKLKASHFPASLLRIGRWEYVSKYEGDLVAKCYFSKHKIVWEVLDGGLKKKFEINWADIVGLKANCAANGPGSLTIVLDKPPLFFKEINPQPRKHTQWRSTSDFTDGEASTQRQHLLQCEQGVLDKHYEKLIQCDTRLNFLSQQQDIILNFPYFPPNTSINDQVMSGNSVFYLPEIYGGNSHMASPNTLLPYSSRTMESGSLGMIHQDKSKEAQSSSSGISMDIDGQNNTRQQYAPGVQPNISLSDLVNHIGNSLSEQNSSMNLPFSNNAPVQGYPKDMLENISQILLSDNQLTAASDERTLMSRVNSLCCLLQDYENGQQVVNNSSIPHQYQIPHQARNDSSTLESILMPVNATPTENLMISSTPGSSQMVQQDGNDNSNPEASGISRKDSFSELVHQLPRIASLPRFLFDISENGEILK
ncbi:hypothetical protein QVD17_11984 [Tagetes erecta]|uniref:TRF2/HOY1 PH-like domain-containing protein n=1 Tax=Tagetes erecta TaxID=13708 RepID=A0AAD8P2P0_TARER|nr:hypothetical protein QVD17_11984 [Tagetes erecta]